MKKLSNIILIFAILCVSGNVFSTVTHCVNVEIKDSHVTPNLSKIHVEVIHIDKGETVETSKFIFSPKENKQQVCFKNFKEKDLVKVNFAITSLNHKDILLSSEIHNMIVSKWFRDSKIKKILPTEIETECNRFGVINIKTVNLPGNKCAPWCPSLPNTKNIIYTRCIFSINDFQNDIWLNEEDVYFD